jgi:hypothetical protein
MKKAVAAHLKALDYAPEMQFHFWMSSPWSFITTLNIAFHGLKLQNASRSFNKAFLFLKHIAAYPVFYEQTKYYVLE